MGYRNNKFSSEINHYVSKKKILPLHSVMSYIRINSQYNINNYDLLIAGSPVKIPIRAEAAYALSKNIPIF